MNWSWRLFLSFISQVSKKENQLFLQQIVFILQFGNILVLGNRAKQMLAAYSN
jgi:uncharacterized SAM-dependent methyltransferase